MSVVYRLTQDNRKQSKTKGKWYARSLHTGVIDIDGLASIMQANCTLKKSDILAVIAELVDVMRAQLQNWRHFTRTIKWRDCSFCLTLNLCL